MKKMKKKNIYAAACTVAKAMVSDRRRFSSKVVADKRRKDPKYKTWRV
jgi:hypothetical protein